MVINKAKESFLRLFIKFHPLYKLLRTRVEISDNWREALVEIKPSLLTRGISDCYWGGWLYACIDHFYGLMVWKQFGLKKYVVWDKKATIHYKKPATGKIRYPMKITKKDVQAIAKDLKKTGRAEAKFQVKAIDESGNICCIIDKVIVIKKR